MQNNEPLHQLPDAGAALAGIKMPQEKEIRRKETAAGAGENRNDTPIPAV